MKDERDPNNLTPEERALVESGAEPDLPSGMPPLAALLQSTSLQLQPGNTDFVVGACQGDFLVPRDGGFVLIKGTIGITFVPVGFETQWPQFRPFRGGYAGVTHASKPVNAKWLKPEKTFDKPASPDGKQGNYLIDADGNPGDKIEETLYLHALVLPGDSHPPHGVSFSFHSTSLSIGKDFGKRAERLQVTTNGHPLKGYVVAKWKLTSFYKKPDKYGWWEPVLSLVGKLGEASGPTREETLLAARLRANFKQGLTPVLEAARAAPEIEGPPEPPAPLSEDASFDGPPEPPPYDRNPDDDIDDVDFGP
jgi:hypothetical protein